MYDETERRLRVERVNHNYEETETCAEGKARPGQDRRETVAALTVLKVWTDHSRGRTWAQMYRLVLEGSSKS